MRTSFTLIELLVVVAIIAVLVAILLPSLTAARDSSRRAVCLANLRSTGQALAMYGDAYHGWLPRRTGWWSDFVYNFTYEHDWGNLFVLHETSDIGRGVEALICPSYPGVDVAAEEVRRRDRGDTNEFLRCQGYWYLQDTWRVSEIPDDRIGQWTSANEYMWWYHRQGVAGYPVVVDYCRGRYGYVAGFYHGDAGLNALFGDGHARWFDTYELYGIMLDDVENGDGDHGLYGPRDIWFALDRMD